MLAEPRVQTGKWTMFYMAVSLAFTAGGIILLYLLWDAPPVDGQTLNAVVFGAIIASLELGRLRWRDQRRWPDRARARGRAAIRRREHGFLGGPAVLANMAADSWVPHQFR